MGAIASRDTRRISFDNSFALSAPINVEKSIEIENAIAFDNIPTESSSQLLFNEKFAEPGEEGDGDYWTHRVDYLKKEHQIINQILESEYDKNIGASTFNYESPKRAHEKMLKIKPCFDWRAKILKCYEENSRQPLMCSSTVQAFVNCVSDLRRED